MRVSVVVPTYRRPELLARCLVALDAQELDPAAYEVIVADDAACEETCKQVRTAAARSRAALRYLPVTGSHGPAAARNAGWRAARGAVIAFTDDDCIPEPHWLAEGLRTLDADPTAAAATGKVVVPLPARPTDYQRDTAGLEAAEFVTANCFCRREALARLGGFDERFTAAWREDSDLHFALLEDGARIVRVPAAVVVHPVRPAPWGVCLWQQRKSLFDALLYKKHPALYRAHVRPGCPWHYYAILLALGTGLAGAGLGNAELTAAAAAAWAGLTARFCLQRLRGNSLAPGHVLEMAVTSALIPALSVFWRLYGAAKFRVWFW